jgi:L-cysteine:1D-myo-inositol 2-amino-2-deoxy-alpha-D-glucopyranoside ligase
MSVSALASTVDIHGGGTDLVFPHHECKRAIVEAITGEPFVRHWVFTGVVTCAGEKMSKTLGNLVFVGEFLRCCVPMVLRIAVMSHNCRSGFEWHNSMLEPSKQLLC